MAGRGGGVAGLSLSSPASDRIHDRQHSQPLGRDNLVVGFRTSSGQKGGHVMNYKCLGGGGVWWRRAGKVDMTQARSTMCFPRLSCRWSRVVVLGPTVTLYLFLDQIINSADHGVGRCRPLTTPHHRTSAVVGRLYRLSGLNPIRFTGPSIGKDAFFAPSL